MNRQISTHDEALKKKFSGYRFVISAIGIFKLLTIILFLIASVLSLTSKVCAVYGQWLEISFSIMAATGGVLVAILYACSILGLSKKIPNLWPKVDISCCLIIAVITLVFSIMMLASCLSSGVGAIPGVFGIIGALLLTVTAAAVFISWRNVDDDIELPPPRTVTEDKRKSIFI